MPKVTQTIRTDIGANSVDDNILENTKVHNVPTDDDYAVTILATADSFNVEHKLEADTDVLVQQSPIGNDDRRPINPDDHIGTWAVTGGSKLFLRVEETGGAAQKATHTVILTPLSEV